MISYPWDSIVEAIGDDGFPIYDRDYKAADLQSLNGRIFSNGVFMDEPDAFVVTPAEGMNVILSTGWCCINGTFGNEPNMRELAIQSSAATQDRIDTVVLRWNANIEMRNIDVYVKTGVASDVPVRPTLTRDSTVYELGIADIFVTRGSGAISAARITDTRLQTDRCGAVTPFMQIDTTTFFNQIQAAIDERTAELEEQTAKAVELAQSAIDGTTAGNLQSQIDANKEAIESNKATDDERWDSLSHVAMQQFDKVFTVPANKLDYEASFSLDLPDGYRPICLSGLVKRNNGYLSLSGWAFTDSALIVYIDNTNGTAMMVGIQASVVAAKVEILDQG